jgi:hypothetical protein
MFPATALSEEKLEICRNTISSNTFYMMVQDALVRRQRLSVVRMGDGEVHLMNACMEGDAKEVVTIANQPEEWHRRLGILGIPKGDLRIRMNSAAIHCDWFAPSVSGISSCSYDLYSLFPKRERYVDNFFVNAWTDEMKIGLFQTAKEVLFIHHNTASADAMQIRAKYALGVKVTFIKLQNWEQTEDVVMKAGDNGAPLVLFSAGPAGKYIGPAIAHYGPVPKVAIDLGNAADYWLLNSLKDIPNGRR